MDNYGIVFDLYSLAMILLVALPPIMFILWLTRLVGRRIHKTIVPKNQQ